MVQIHMTPTAVENVQRLIDELGPAGSGLRFGLSGGGCSGYRYVLELEGAPAAGDTVYDFGGVRVFLSPDHAEQLAGSTIDWVDTLMESGFKIENPQAKRACGCGESFDI